MVKRRGDPKLYRHWHQWLMAWNPDRPREIDKATLIAVAFSIAAHGNFGVECYPGDTAIGKIVGRDRDTVARYRKFLVKHGAFRPTGRKVGRVAVLDIAVPGEQESPAPVANEAPAARESGPPRCARCNEPMVQQESGWYLCTTHQLWKQVDIA